MTSISSDIKMIQGTPCYNGFVITEISADPKAGHKITLSYDQFDSRGSVADAFFGYRASKGETIIKDYEPIKKLGIEPTQANAGIVQQILSTPQLKAQLPADSVAIWEGIISQAESAKTAAAIAATDSWGRDPNLRGRPTNMGRPPDDRILQPAIPERFGQ